MMTVRLWAVLAMIAGFFLAAPGTTVAQDASMLDASEAADYMGEWVLTMTTRRGSNEETLSVTDVDGRVAAALSGGRGGTITITDITKSGDDLVLKFERRGRGNAAPVVMTLTLDGDTLNATQDINNGAFTMSGTGRKSM